MITFDKHKIREQLTLENIYSLLTEWGGEPEYTSYGLLSSTICHNPPGEGSQKLYYYSNTGLFKCYTGCENSTFDIFELYIKVSNIQLHKQYDLNEAVRVIAQKCGILGEITEAAEGEQLEDWQYLSEYDKIKNLEIKNTQIILPTFDDKILSYLNYDLKITPWLNEGIKEEVMRQALIGYYLGADQITIPHFDQNNRFIGLRGRSMVEEDCERFGKYRPVKINGILYNHPLGMNLYNLNNSKNNIKLIKKAIVFESEKASLLYRSYFGPENDISVACCGFNLSNQQMQLLLDSGAEEIIIAFDRQFKEIGDNEFHKLKNNLLRIREKYKNYATISFIFDKNMITNYKASPIDESEEKFLQLFNERITI